MKESWKTRFFRYFMNWHPTYSGTGAKVRFVSSDFREIRIELPLSWRTRNYVGSIFGGSIYAAADPVYMLQLIKILGPDYVVWDKAARLRFLRPGRASLFAQFSISQELLDSIKERIAREKEADFDLLVEWRDKEGKLHALVDKTLYIAQKEHYKAKQAERKKTAKP